MDEQDNNAPRSPAEEQARIVEEMKKLEREFKAAAEARFQADVADLRKTEPEQADALIALHDLSVKRQFGRETLTHLKSISGGYKPTDIMRSMRVGSSIAKPMIAEEMQTNKALTEKIHAGEIDMQEAMKVAEEMVNADMRKAVLAVCGALELRPYPEDVITAEALRSGTLFKDDVLPSAWSVQQKDTFLLAVIFVSSFMSDRHAPEMPDDELLPAGTVDRPERRA